MSSSQISVSPPSALNRYRPRRVALALSGPGSRQSAALALARCQLRVLAGQRAGFGPAALESLLVRQLAAVGAYALACGLGSSSLSLPVPRACSSGCLCSACFLCVR